ncbi:helix-turn-helix transcriptional regulator [Actinoplanes sp. NPDC051346]|uniref:helix-turn-helix transcriptional regulator n=1 Tax=Actinoplanes sp. NPDC051346 TaxID=3155048 RepID=UPI00341391F1
MATRVPRVTASLIAVIDALIDAPRDDPPWGLRLCEQTGYGPGTVYPLLDRLHELGWVEAYWEDANPHGGKPRRFYAVTGLGVREYQAARKARTERTLRWRPATP